MAYKMNGFSGFKESPVKQKGDNLKKIMTAKKELAKQTGTFYKPGAEPKVKVPNVKGFNKTGSKASTTPGYSTTKAAKEGSFNKTGSKASKTPGFSTTKMAKGLKKAGKFFGGKLAGTLGMMGAGTLNATATPKGKAKKKGSYTDDFTKLK